MTDQHYDLNKLFQSQLKSNFFNLALAGKGTVHQHSKLQSSEMDTLVFAVQPKKLPICVSIELESLVHDVAQTFWGG